MSKICVIGSLNVDLVVNMPRFHGPGETIIASGFSTFAGGKGGNQAVAASRLTEGVLMVGMLGDDENAAFYRAVLESNRVDASATGTAAGTPSGVALIEVDSRGENRIAVVPGANALVDAAWIDSLMPTLLCYDLFMFQLEIPLETVAHAAGLLRAAGKRVMLDPAPAQPLPDGLLGHVDILTPNETELSILSGLPTATEREARLAAQRLIDGGARAVVAKMGGRGALYIDRERECFAPGFKVDVVDTTAAGDSFNAGLAVALCEDLPIEAALRFANAVGALSVMGAGAQGAMPTRAQVDAFLARHPDQKTV